MARLSQREIIRLRKQVVVMRSDLNRQIIAADWKRVSASLAWLPAALNVTKTAAPLLAFAAPWMARKSTRSSSLKRLISGGLLGWRLFRKLRPRRPDNGAAQALE